MRKEKVTNPKILRLRLKKMDLASLKYRNKFLDNKTGLYKKKYTERRSCPVCNSNNKTRIFQKEGGFFVKCNKCTMVYLDPVFKDRELIKYYKNNIPIQSAACVMGNDFYDTIYNSGLKIIQKHIKSKNKKILDVGCCSGMFLDIAKKKGWLTYGTELNKKEYIMAKKNHVVWSDDLEEIDFNEKFDAVTFWDVFEHLKKPTKVLKFIRKILKKNGVIFLQIPNSNSLAAKILREKCNMFDPIEHVNLYNKDALKLLSKKHKLKILEMVSVIDELNVIKNYLNYEHPYLGSQRKFKEMKFLNTQNIHMSYSGYKLQVLISL